MLIWNFFATNVNMDL